MGEHLGLIVAGGRVYGFIPAYLKSLVIGGRPYLYDYQFWVKGLAFVIFQGVGGRGISLCKFNVHADAHRVCPVHFSMATGAVLGLLAYVKGWL